jgi:hypothetical protein
MNHSEASISDASDDSAPARQQVEEPRSDAEEIERIRALPKEVGVLLIVAGISGLLLPGPIGSPLVLMGGVMLWPRAFEKVELWFEKRFPRAHHQSVRQMKRFLDDLDRRYPLSR